MDSIKPVESEADLLGLFGSFSSGDEKGRNEAMKDQIQVRIHVYKIKAAKMPNMDRLGSARSPMRNDFWKSSSPSSLHHSLLNPGAFSLS